VHKRITSAVKGVEFVGMSYIILRGYWCCVIIQNIQALMKDKIDDVKASFYEELEFVFNEFPKFNAKIGR
jgi:hypothetical protein